MTRRATVPSLAKINLDLRVLYQRPDGFHELRTVFQTISLRDTIEIEFEPARRTTVTLDDPLAIPDNIILHATHLVLEAMRLEVDSVADRPTRPRSCWRCRCLRAEPCRSRN
jgi:4-diphosphocytidyl-2-C-methyl-D-erythritol kinase